MTLLGGFNFYSIISLQNKMQHLPVSIIYTLKNINQTSIAFHFTIDLSSVFVDKKQNKYYDFSKGVKIKWNGFA